MIPDNLIDVSPKFANYKVLDHKLGKEIILNFKHGRIIGDGRA